MTFLVNDAFELDESSAEDFESRGVSIETTPIERIDGDADVMLVDGKQLRFKGLFTVPTNEPTTQIAKQLGCELVETPMGAQIGNSDSKETTIAGAFTCGDVARVPHTLSLAVGDGAMARTQLHRSLVWPDG